MNVVRIQKAERHSCYCYYFKIKKTRRKLLTQTLTQTNINPSLHLSHTLIIWVNVKLCTNGVLNTLHYITLYYKKVIIQYWSGYRMNQTNCQDISDIWETRSSHHTLMCYKETDAAAWIKNTITQGGQTDGNMLNVQKRRNTVVCSTASAERRSLEHWADTSVKRTCGCVVLLPLVAVVITLTLKVDKSFNYAQKSAETQVGKKTISLLIHPSKGHQICKTENKNTILSIDHSLYRVCVWGGELMQFSYYNIYFRK